MSLSERKREALAAKTKRPRELPLAKEAPGRRTVASPKKQIEATSEACESADRR
jgi:hypothetical protein